MANNPYIDIPDYQRWSRAVTKIDPDKVDPVCDAPFTISITDKVATAGSCFAQHIAFRLAQSGFNYYIAEQAHPLIPPHLAKQWNYGTFSCRFGNVYTARQLRQLWDRAFGHFRPVERAWEKDGFFVSPLRPAIQPLGFLNTEELEIDEVQHLAAVRKMFECCDVFVFTLGLTEFWSDARDGTAFPVAPGVIAGNFDRSIHQFSNQSVYDVVNDLRYFMDQFTAVNPKARVIFTVSPVALAATAENRHVITSTVYSKSVLRVAAEEIARTYDCATYFPSFEIITGSFNRGAYYADDRREVTESGVSHVMRLFFKHFAPSGSGAYSDLNEISSSLPFEEQARKIAQAVCEEKELDSN